jgi:hypothetical protein
MSISYRYNDTKFARLYVCLEHCGHENLENARICRNGMALLSTKVMYKTLTELSKFIVLAAEAVSKCGRNYICASGVSLTAVRLRILGRVYIIICALRPTIKSLSHVQGLVFVIKFPYCDARNSCGCGYKCRCLLGCDAVQIVTNLPAFKRELLPQSDLFISN